MSKIEVTKRQQMIVRMLREESLSMEEIQKRLNAASTDEYDLNVSKRTFARDIYDIRSIYGIEIAYRSFSRTYAIVSGDGDDGQARVFNSRMNESYDVFDSLKADKNFRQYILLDERKSDDEHYLGTILTAIKARRVIRFKYTNYEKNENKWRTVKPVYIKEYRGRWYLISNESGKSRIFALERMRCLETTSEVFDRHSLPDVCHVYENCFGLNLPNPSDKIENVQIAVNPVCCRYLESMPLHKSQQIISKSDDASKNGCIINLKLYITYDFVMELRSLGNIDVIKPKSLAEKIAKASSNMMII